MIDVALKGETIEITIVVIQMDEEDPAVEVALAIGIDETVLAVEVALAIGKDETVLAVEVCLWVAVEAVQMIRKNIVETEVEVEAGPDHEVHTNPAGLIEAEVVIVAAIGSGIQNRQRAHPVPFLHIRIDLWGKLVNHGVLTAEGAETRIFLTNNS